MARVEGYVVSVGRGLRSGWWPEGSGGRLKDTCLAEVGRVDGEEAWGTSYGARVRVRRSSRSVRGMSAGLGTSHSKERRTSRWPKEVASARGGLCRTIVGVRRGIGESQPARTSTLPLYIPYERAFHALDTNRRAAIV
jgi:hypothetical protein